MKRITTIMLAILLVLSLTACGGAEAPSTSTPTLSSAVSSPESTGTAEPEKKSNIRLDTATEWLDFTAETAVSFDSPGDYCDTDYESYNVFFDHVKEKQFRDVVDVSGADSEDMEIVLAEYAGILTEEFQAAGCDDEFDYSTFFMPSIDVSGSLSAGSYELRGIFFSEGDPLRQTWTLTYTVFENQLAGVDTSELSGLSKLAVGLDVPADALDAILTHALDTAQANDVEEYTLSMHNSGTGTWETNGESVKVTVYKRDSGRQVTIEFRTVVRY